MNQTEESGKASKACKVKGRLRDTRYRNKAVVEDGGIEVPFEKLLRKPKRNNRIDEATDATVL